MSLKRVGSGFTEQQLAAHADATYSHIITTEGTAA